MARARARMLAQAREFFAARSVMEVETPVLSPCATLDPNVASIEASPAITDAFLVTSPEYHMKRLLAADYGNIYQICRVFRDGESGRHHLTEFTMLEWYRLNFSLREMMDETVACLQGFLCSDQGAWEVDTITYSDAIKNCLGVDPLNVNTDTLRAAMDVDADLAASLAEDINAWLDLAMAEFVAPTFNSQRLTVVYHYPLEQAALARQCPGDVRLADRFEVFAGSIELANGFVELQDADIQRSRFRDEQAQRIEMKLPAHELDEQLLSALSAGIPECAGVAVGLDRVLMVAAQVADIHNTVTFSLDSIN